MSWVTESGLIITYFFRRIEKKKKKKKEDFGHRVLPTDVMGVDFSLCKVKSKWQPGLRCQSILLRHKNIQKLSITNETIHMKIPKTESYPRVAVASGVYRKNLLQLAANRTWSARRRIISTALHLERSTTAKSAPNAEVVKQGFLPAP